jgi:hypothetical protein
VRHKNNVVAADDLEFGSGEIGSCLPWREQNNIFIKRASLHNPSRERVGWIMLEHHKLSAPCEALGKLYDRRSALRRVDMVHHIRRYD